MTTLNRRTTIGTPLTAIEHDQNLDRLDRRSRSLLAYGVAPGRNAASALQTALDEMYAGAFDCLVIPPGQWPLEASITAEMRDGTGVIATGARFTPAASTTFEHITLQGPKGTIITGRNLAADLQEDAVSATLSDASGLRIGDILQIESDKNWAATTGTGAATERLIEVQVVRAIRGNQVWFDAPMLFGFRASESSARTVMGLTVTAIRPVQHIFWQGGHFDLGNAASELSPALRILHAIYPEVRGVSFSYPIRSALYLEHCAYVRVSDCNFLGVGKPSLGHPDQGYASAVDTSKGDYGYGVYLAKCCYVSVQNCFGGRGWHSFECAYGTRDATFSQCKAHSDTYAFSAHSGVGRLTLENCIVEGKNGVTFRGSQLEILGGTFRCHSPAIGFADKAMFRRIRVQGAVFEMLGEGTRIISEASNTSAQWHPDISAIYEGCTFRGARTGPGKPQVDLGNPSYHKVIVRNCTFLDGARPAIAARKVIDVSNTLVDDMRGHQSAMLLAGADGQNTLALVSDLRFTGTNDSTAPFLIQTWHVTAHVSGLQQHMDIGSGAVFRQSTPAPVHSTVFLTDSTLMTGHVGQRVNMSLVKSCRFLPGAGTSLEVSDGGRLGDHDGNWFADAS